MTWTSPLAGAADDAPHSFSLARSPMGAAIVFQIFIWTLGPALLAGNLHADTLEAAYWGREWAFGYAKHPPITTWAIDLALRLRVFPIFFLMLLSQLTVAVASWFLWRAVRMYGSAETAALAVTMYLVSPAATFYAVQVNHNSMLAPFFTATLFYGLRYLEDRRWRDAIILGVVAALGLYTKYEILLLLVTLLALACLVPRFRPAFREQASYASALIFVVLAIPHVWWLQAHDWPSLSHALEASKMNSIATLTDSGVNLIVGVFALCVMPAAILLATKDRRAGDELTRAPECPAVGMAMAFGPPLALVIGAIITLNIIKPLWMQPFSATMAGGLALLFPAGRTGLGLSERASARIAMTLSTAILAGFALYLVIAGAIGKPLWAFSADTRPLATAVENMWKSRQAGPLRCVVIAERKVGPSGVLWLRSRPDYIDFSSPSWSSPSQIAACQASGAVAIIAEPSHALDFFPGACAGSTKRFNIPMMPAQGRVTIPVDLIYIPPKGAAADCQSASPAAR